LLTHVGQITVGRRYVPRQGIIRRVFRRQRQTNIQTLLIVLFRRGVVPLLHAHVAQQIETARKSLLGVSVGRILLRQRLANLQPLLVIFFGGRVASFEHAVAAQVVVAKRQVE